MYVNEPHRARWTGQEKSYHRTESYRAHKTLEVDVHSPMLALSSIQGQILVMYLP